MYNQSRTKINYLGAYNCIISNRAGNKKGDGLALFYKSEIKCKDVDLVIKNSFEYSSWKLCFNNKNLLVIGIYHPPNTRNGSNQVFINEFLKMLVEAQSCNLQLIIMGDFNLHVNNKEDNDAQQILDMLEASGLHQLVEFITHKHGNILDFVIVESASNVKISNLKRGLFLSDNCVVFGELNLPKPYILDKPVKYRNFRKANIKGLIDELCLN